MQQQPARDNTTRTQNRTEQKKAFQEVRSLADVSVESRSPHSTGGKTKQSKANHLSVGYGRRPAREAFGQTVTSCVSNLKCSSLRVIAFSLLNPKCFFDDSHPLIAGYSQWAPTCGAFRTCTRTPSNAMKRTTGIRSAWPEPLTICQLRMGNGRASTHTASRVSNAGGTKAKASHETSGRGGYPANSAAVRCGVAWCAHVTEKVATLSSSLSSSSDSSEPP